jgi:hypothetical protein
MLHERKVFVWLFLVDRLNRHDMVDRRHWKLEYGVYCAVCAHSYRETHGQLLFNYEFALKCWHKFGIVIWPWCYVWESEGKFSRFKFLWNCHLRFVGYLEAAQWTDLWERETIIAKLGGKFSERTWCYRAKTSHKENLQNGLSTSSYAPN